MPALDIAVVHCDSFRDNYPGGNNGLDWQNY